MMFTLKEAALAAAGEYIGDKTAENNAVLSVTIDSRKVEKGSLFVCIKGERFDGHDFASSAFEKGAAAVVAERDVQGGSYIKVASTVDAFRKLAGAYRDKFDIPVVGITGSVGKTTTKEMVSAVLSQRFCTLKNEGNLNNQTGVPITLFRLEEKHRAAVVEMGTNHFGEIVEIASIVKPDIGVITNIGESHIENFGSRDGILKEKADVLNCMKAGGHAIVNGDDDKLSTLRGKYPVMTTYGFDEGNDVRAVELDEKGLEGTAFTVCYKEERVPAFVPAPGRHMVINALCAFSVGLALGMAKEEIVKGIAAYVPASGRMDIIKTKTLTLLSDAYNASPTSMKGSIDVTAYAKGRRVLILGDMFELGENAPRYHREVGEHAGKSGAELVLSVGEMSKHIAEGAREKGAEAVHFDSREALTENLDKYLKAGDTVLVKASHGMGLEAVAKHISENF